MKYYKYNFYLYIFEIKNKKQLFNILICLNVNKYNNYIF